MPTHFPHVNDSMPSQRATKYLAAFERVFGDVVAQPVVPLRAIERETGRGAGPLANGGATFTPLPHAAVEAQRDTGAPLHSEPNEPRPTTKRRWDLLAGIARMLRSGLDAGERGPSVCGCGRPGYDVADVAVHRRDASADRTARAYVSGVYRCGSGWLCPACAPAVAATRQARVLRVVEATTDRGGSFVMGLVTVSHGPTDRLADLKRLVTDSFAAARRGAPWERSKERAGIAGVLVAPEVTHGAAGWHFHVHFGMSCLADENAACEAGEALVQRFMRAVAKRGGTAVRKAQGVGVAASPEAASDYIAKGTSWELASGSSGHKSRSAGRTQWTIAEDALAGCDESFRLWREYAATMPGTRSCVVSPHLAAALEIETGDDTEGGEFVLLEETAVVGTVPAATWTRILKTGLAGTFLDRIENAQTIEGTAFDTIVSETTAEADERHRVIVEKAEAKRLKLARDHFEAAAITRRAALRDAARSASGLSSSLGTRRALANIAEATGLSAAEVGAAVVRLHTPSENENDVSLAA